MSRKVFYTDLNENSPTLRPDVIDERAVSQWLEDYTMTRKGERLFQPDYGVDLDDFLFDLVDDSNAALIFSSLSEQLADRLPMIEILTEDSSIFADTENNAYAIDLHFRLKGFTGTGSYNAVVVLGR